MKKLTTQEFKYKVEKLNNNIDLSNSIYLGYNKPVVVKCKIHNIETTVLAVNLLKGMHKCPDCIKAKRVRNFLDKAQNIFPNYDFSEVNYINSTEKIVIKCNNVKHPPYKISPVSLINGRGCYLCGRERTINATKISQEVFIQRVQNKYNDKYDLSKAIYNGYGVKVIIGCQIKNHGYFEVSPNDFLGKKNSGCPKCNSLISKLESKYLDLLDIPNDKCHRQVRINTKKSYYKVDGLLNNTIYEFLGDYWHGNMQLYGNQPNKRILSNCTAMNLWKKTVDKLYDLKSMGYNIIYMWESNFKKINKYLEYNPHQLYEFKSLLKNNNLYKINRIINPINLSFKVN